MWKISALRITSNVIPNYLSTWGPKSIQKI